MKKFFTELKSGYTTGACAAAGVKAALFYLTAGEIVREVELTALDGTVLEIPIEKVEILGEIVRVEVIKFSGDDPDITDGVSVFTAVKKISGDKIIFLAGEGVGHVTKPGLQIPVGEPAINPGPRQLIKNVAAQFNLNALQVEISIPAGVELAKKTLNPHLGVVGGISILGTTGILRPMSEDAFKFSLVAQIDVAKAAGFQELVFVPGKIGETFAKKLGYLPQQIIQTSNFIGFMLQAAADRSVKKVILCGHIGKLIKLAAGVFNTHNRLADARLETLAAYSAAEGLPSTEIKNILSASTVDQAIHFISPLLRDRVFNSIAERIVTRSKRFVFNQLDVGVILTDYKCIVHSS